MREIARRFQSLADECRSQVPRSGTCPPDWEDRQVSLTPGDEGFRPTRATTELGHRLRTSRRGIDDDPPRAQSFRCRPRLAARSSRALATGERQMEPCEGY